jgi:glutamate/tyrosine decarboxylase-like PLP-dependent enzyme
MYGLIDFCKSRSMTEQAAFETLDPADWEGMRRLAHRMVDDAFDYYRQVRDRPAWLEMPPEAKERFNVEAPRHPSDPQAVYEAFREDIAPYTMHTAHPRFWSWYMGSATPFGAMADFLAAVLNPNVGGGNHAAPVVERQVLEWIRQMMGFPEGSSGLLTSGASMANFTALTVARNRAAGFDVRREGVQAADGALTVYASTEIHSCNVKAVETLGLGSHGLCKVAVRPDYSIDLADLERQVAADRANGKIPFCVIATSGTINTGAIDDLNGVADFCAREKLWFHVDGAIGAVAVLADNVREQLSGIERADSVALDLHKWMHVPFEAGCVLVRDEAAHRDAFALVPEYLARAEDDGGLAAGDAWLSDYGLQLSRSFRALKIWMLVKEHGLDRFGRMMARNVDQARYLGQLIEQSDRFQLMAPIGLDIVCFRYDPGDRPVQELNRLNKRLLVSLHESGVAAPSYTTLGDSYCLRVAIANHRSTREDFNLMLETLERLGAELE